MMQKWLAILLLLCSSCAVYDDNYWHKEYDALPVKAVIEVENIPTCGIAKETPFYNILGCTYRVPDPGYAVIYIDKNLSSACKKCVLSHEENHAMWRWSRNDLFLRAELLCHCLTISFTLTITYL